MTRPPTRRRNWSAASPRWPRRLSNDARWTLSYQLQQAGFSIAVASGAAATADTDEVPPELQKRLSLEPGQTIDRKRALRLTAVLIDLVVTMDQVSWSLWKNLAPNSIVRRDPGATGDLKRLAGPYLLGDNEVSTTQLTQVLDKTRQLIAGLLAAIGATGETFARQFLGRYSPQAIKDLAEADPGFFIGAEQKCWRKYIQVFNELSGVAIENEITGTIAKYTENLILARESIALRRIEPECPSDACQRRRCRILRTVITPVAFMAAQIHWHEGLFLLPHHLQRLQKSVSDGLGRGAQAELGVSLWDRRIPPVGGRSGKHAAALR